MKNCAIVFSFLKCVLEVGFHVVQLSVKSGSPCPSLLTAVTATVCHNAQGGGWFAFCIFQDKVSYVALAVLSL